MTHDANDTDRPTEPALDPAGFGAVVRARRGELGLSLADVAERVGCARSYLSAIETGRRATPSEEIVGRLEGALELPEGELRRRAEWARTPAGVRAGVARLRAASESASRTLAELAASGSLDEAYRSGRLQALVAAMGGKRDVAPAALPMEVPLINKVAAGYPAGFTDLGYPARVADEYVRVPDLSDPDAFAARVVGDSMSPDYREGDVVVFSPARDLVDGCDCFARLEPDDESTFKRVYFEKGEDGAELIRLQPVNHRYPARTLPREKVAGLYRAVKVVREV